MINTARVRSTREGNVLTRVCPSINLSVHRGGYPYPIMLCNISQNAMRQRGGTRTSPGGYPGQVPPQGGYPGQVPPPGGGYPGRTTEGVLTTRRAVCLLRSRRRTFLWKHFFRLFHIGSLFSLPSYIGLDLLSFITKTDLLVAREGDSMRVYYPFIFLNSQNKFRVVLRHILLSSDSSTYICVCQST